MLDQPLDLTDVLLAEHQEYRALWARHYVGMEPPQELAQAVNVWQNASALAALNEAGAARQTLSLVPKGTNPENAEY